MSNSITTLKLSSTSSWTNIIVLNAAKKKSNFIKHFNNITCHKCTTSANTIKETQRTSFCGNHTITMNNRCICVICNKTEVHGIMNIDIKSPSQHICHYKVLYGPVKEHWSFSVPTLNSTDGHRLCDIKGCSIYGPELNNDFIGFFCNIHYKDVIEL